VRRGAQKQPVLEVRCEAAYELTREICFRFGFLFPAMGILVCLLETGYPVFIWLKQTRRFWLAGILLMHLLIGLTMGLYLFALIMIVLNLAAFGSDLFPDRFAVSGRRWLIYGHIIETRETR
jgi:hypothetical protein